MAILHTRMMIERDIHDILHGIWNFDMEEVLYGDHVTFTATGGFATFTVSGSYAALLLLAVLLRYWCAGWVGRFISPHGVLVGTGGVLLDLGGMHYCITLY
ncbi:Uncharacterized protein F383_06605 [Gossypium arboreum]|uniref:Uncharacterized protein n=1 Tax=Gossypium arboreum TaxID=29729 RepID=A0A0B0N5P2_GOSAR|nr:Uncharacterized protein F383_34871 [Gossypium arboreum]KHG11565.1 Uncharacterized protein F383_06605 [Gossypium arboreum]